MGNIDLKISNTQPRLKKTIAYKKKACTNCENILYNIGEILFDKLLFGSEVLTCWQFLLSNQITDDVMINQ